MKRIGSVSVFISRCTCTIASINCAVSHFLAISIAMHMQSRQDILKIHSRKMNLMRGIDLKKIAEKMNGASGAELKVCQIIFLV